MTHLYLHNNMKKKIGQFLVHKIFPARKQLNKYLNKLVPKFKDAEILEFGSGVNTKFSAKNIFINTKSFKQTDVNPDFGHDVLDVRDVSRLNKEYDLVLCCNVIEHVYENERIVSNLKKLVKKNGHLLISVPFIYPLHDEPGDYWRYTEHTLKKMFEDFHIEDFKYNGLREFPYQYIMLLKNK